MKWYFATASKYDYKSHVISEELYEKVEESLYSRGCSSLNKKEITKTGFDLPGMIMVDRNIHDVPLSGLIFQIPSTDVGTFIDMVDSLKERDEIGVKYYKLHGYQHCICLTPAQREELSNNLKQILNEALAYADIENELFNKNFTKAKERHILVKTRPVRKKKFEA